MCPKEGHLGPELNFHFLNFFGSESTKKSVIPRVWLKNNIYKQYLKTKLVQNITFKIAKIGPVHLQTILGVKDCVASDVIGSAEGFGAM